MAISEASTGLLSIPGLFDGVVVDRLIDVGAARNFEMLLMALFGVVVGILGVAGADCSVKGREDGVFIGVVESAATAGVRTGESTSIASGLAGSSSRMPTAGDRPA
jgi:hypothetical protein